MPARDDRDEAFRLLELALIAVRRAIESPDAGALVVPDVPLGPRVYSRLHTRLNATRAGVIGLALTSNVASARYDELALAARALGDALVRFEKFGADPKVREARQEVSLLIRALLDASSSRRRKQRGG